MTASLARRLAGLVLATAILHLVLIQPNHPGAMTWQALLLFPLELPVIVLGLMALPRQGWPQRAIRAVLVVALVVLAVLKAADTGMFMAFNRPFNPLVDIHLIDAGLRLLAGTLGEVQATLVGIGAAILPFLLAFLLWWATGRWVRVEPPPLARGAAMVLALLAGGLAVAEIGQARRAWALPFDPPGAAFTARVAIERTETYRALLADLDAFRQAAQGDALAGAPGLFDGLAGADMLVVFIESYGRASFDNRLYAPTHVETLRAAEDAIATGGAAVLSGWLTSPISGGQSWLAHATFASGLKTDNQARYSALLASPHRTLYHLAADAGYRTAAIMPAITLPWPEARLLGFQADYPAAALGYRGDPFNWVTMPDQFTLAAFDRLLPPGDTPLAAQVVLVSSHAPWVPVPEMVGWDEVGDGTIFNRWANSGDPPSVVWRDQNRVREQYRLAIDYSLAAVTDYLARHAGDDRVTVVLGDHPPVNWVSGIESFDVPVHVIGPPARLARLAGWGFTPGLIPDASSPVWPMEAFRDRFVRAFTDSPLPEPTR